MDDLIQAEVVEPGESRAMSRKEIVEEQTAAIRDDLHQRAAINQLAILEWARVTENQKEPPKDWVERFGLEKACEMLVIARSAHRSTREAPVGLKMIQETFRGLESGRAADRLARSPNAVTIIVGEPPPALPSMPAPKSSKD